MDLKFKKEWFEVLNRCNVNLRKDVMEAVFQYFFNGAEPDFTDEARIIAFGFIRADIDAARRRRELRLARKSKTQQPEPPAVTPTPMPAPTPAQEIAQETAPPITGDEINALSIVLKHWNTVMKDCDGTPMKNTLLPTDKLYAPAINALRRMHLTRICDAIQRLRHIPNKPQFADFFNSLK